MRRRPWRWRLFRLGSSIHRPAFAGSAQTPPARVDRSPEWPLSRHQRRLAFRRPAQKAQHRRRASPAPRTPPVSPATEPAANAVLVTSATTAKCLMASATAVHPTLSSAHTNSRRRGMGLLSSRTRFRASCAGRWLKASRSCWKRLLLIFVPLWPAACRFGRDE